VCGGVPERRQHGGCDGLGPGIGPDTQPAFERTKIRFGKRYPQPSRPVTLLHTPEPVDEHDDPGSQRAEFDDLERIDAVHSTDPTTTAVLVGASAALGVARHAHQCLHWQWSDARSLGLAGVLRAV
jgi:hypothetical protein